MLRYLPYLLVLALWIYAFIDCLNTPEEEVRHLPKVVWVIIVLLFGEVLIGPVAWLVAGKARTAAAGGALGLGRRGSGGWVAPDDNPEFLNSLRTTSSGNDRPTGDGSRDTANAADAADSSGGADDRDAALLKDWEADLRRREEELRRREGGQEQGGRADGSDKD